MDNIPWIEKYRPKLLKDLILDDITYKKIQYIMETKDMPNLLFSGPPGIGKTTVVLCIINNLLGKYHDQGVLELNASDERGIKSVQETIKYFCKKTIDFGEDTDKLSKHKIIMLDEADNITSKAQYLINILMETYYKNTRFALTCNKSSDIIEAIQSRCLIIKLCKPSEAGIVKRLEDICMFEKLNYETNALKLISKNSNGDVRNAINNLQLIANNNNNSIKFKIVNIFFDNQITTVIDSILMESYNKNFISALNNVYELKNEGHSINDIIQNMFNRLKDSEFNKLDIDIKIKYINIVSTTLYILSKGLENDIQLTACIAELCNV